MSEYDEPTFLVPFLGLPCLRFLITYTYCPEQAPIPEQSPTPNFDSFVVFKVLRVTAHHAKFLRSESEGRSAELK